MFLDSLYHLVLINLLKALTLTGSLEKEITDINKAKETGTSKGIAAKKDYYLLYIALGGFFFIALFIIYFNRIKKRKKR